MSAASLRVLFDVTRRLARGATASGIDRVDLAYLSALSGSADIELLPVRFGPLGAELVPAFATGGGAPRPESGEGQRLHAWLESPAGTTAPTASRRARPRLPLEVLYPGSPLAVLRLQRVLARPGPPTLYLNTSHGRLYRPRVARFLSRTGLRSVFFVHDLIPIEYPQFNRRGEPARHSLRLATIATHASRVLVNSGVTAASLLDYWARRGLPAPPVDVVPLGVAPGLAGPATPPRAQVPYFVVLGTLEPRKNHHLLLMIWQRLAEQAPRLVCVGRRGWDNRTVFRLLDGMRGESTHVAECGDLDDAQLASVLRGARALLSPSLAEGFGLPVAEALAAGVPVVASDIPAHREVARGCAELLDPFDGDGWERAITEYAQPASVRRAVAQARTRRYRAQTWSAHFAQVLPVLHEVACSGATGVVASHA